MGRYRVEYIRNKCIGAFACVSIDPDHFAMNDDNKADLVRGTKVQEEANGKDELWVFETDDLGNLAEGARACPVNIIKVIDKQTGKILAP